MIVEFAAVRGRLFFNGYDAAVPVIFERLVNRGIELIRSLIVGKPVLADPFSSVIVAKTFNPLRCAARRAVSSSLFASENCALHGVSWQRVNAKSSTMACGFCAIALVMNVASARRRCGIKSEFVSYTKST